ncbi:DeoR/GlpR family DNA-binding transcription regulator [Hufsiella ginkgonis]|uniref:DeoR family transcriptional regulator n=1 Tax=Hufsiella ginkgonis TaxID=2695274 RepID=A0A7K1XUA3_9SPHI|nr:DeoR/GlpR family DNA-binding transcription regulator [Hufsiella ginkgonis]MXV14591.1 DeoR family transcriptional regulator [Hufsiella ginkgonis]
MLTPTVNLLKKERHAFIIKQVNLHNKVLSSDLSQQLNVSEDTVRRDLNELAETGKVLKVHGGALSRSFHFPFRDSETYALDSKKEVARKALGMIKDGMVILTAGGTTMIELARMVPDDLRVTFFTISPLVALELNEHAGAEVILVGGQLSKNSQVNIGSQTVSFLHEIQVDICFLGTNGVSAGKGITDSDWEIVQVKKAMIKSANRSVILSISEKLDSVQPMKVCGLNQVSALVTELDPQDKQLAAYRNASVQLI